MRVKICPSRLLLKSVAKGYAFPMSVNNLRLTYITMFIAVQMFGGTTVFQEPAPTAHFQVNDVGY